jgi:hypothetical protein
MEKQTKKIDVWFIAIISIWGVLTYALALLLFNMYTSEDSAVLFWCAVVVFTPAGIYFAIPMAARENAKWYKFLGYSIMISLFLVFIGYFTLLKTDLLWSLFTKPTTSGILYIKNVKKDYLPKHGWDHTNVNTIYNNKPLEFEATRTAYFLLKDKDSLNVTIGRSIVGNYFITDIHLPGTERWAARKSYWINCRALYLGCSVFSFRIYGCAIERTLFSKYYICTNWVETVCVIMRRYHGRYNCADLYKLNNLYKIHTQSLKRIYRVNTTFISPIT